MDAAQTVQNLNHGSESPTHERQIRPLTKLQPDQQREAWQLATQISPQPTATEVEQVVETMQKAFSDASRLAIVQAGG
jgi:hypothetical protein